MEIRRARPEEWGAIGELTVAAYLVDGHLSLTDSYLPVLRDAAARATEADLWVAVAEGAVVGTVTYCPPGSPFRELGGDDDGEFRTLAVSPQARGLGAGTALVRHCLALARAAGHSQVVISTLPRMTAAHRIYRSLGFSRDESRDWTPKPDTMLWAFRRPLGGADLAWEDIFTVGMPHTALAVGSGSLPVLGTPTVLAWSEAVTCAALEPLLQPGETSVGVEVALEHLAASSVGARIRVRAESTDVAGRRHTFAVTAVEEAHPERVLARAQITRQVVNAEKFLARLP